MAGPGRSRAARRKPTASAAPRDLFVNDPAPEAMAGPQADVLEPGRPVEIENPRSPPNRGPGQNGVGSVEPSDRS